MKKNLIIGAATGYKYADMRHFFDSLKSIDFKGDIAILVSDKIDEETKHNLLARGVILLYVKNMSLWFSSNYAQSRMWKIHKLPHKLLFRLLSAGKHNLQRLAAYVKIFHLISGSRYCYYYDYLILNKEKYELVLITDVRDVVFQADPFSENTGKNFLKFYAEENFIADSFYTSYWIKHAFGSKALSIVKSEISLCSGTTIGSVNQILVYLTGMIKTLAKITPGLTGLGGFDQGVHNYLVHNNFFPQSTLVKNIEGEVATLGEITSPLLNDDMELVNKSNKVVPIVHQFNRLPDLRLKALAHTEKTEGRVR